MQPSSGIRGPGYDESRTVDGQLGVSNDLLDAALGLEIGKRLPGEGAVDLETIDEGSDRDQTVGLDILLELLVGLLVEDNGVLGLVLDCGLCQWRSLRRRLPAPGTARGLALLRCKSAVSSRRGNGSNFGSRAQCPEGVWEVTYPCPWTTSSSASWLRCLRVPVELQLDIIPAASSSAARQYVPF